MTKRLEKLDSLLQRKIGEIIKEKIDSSPEVLITITKVQTSSDLSQVKVGISVIPKEKSNEIILLLKKEVRNIQNELNEILRVYRVPKIIFLIDKEQEQTSRVEEILLQLKKEEK